MEALKRRVEALERAMSGQRTTSSCCVSSEERAAYEHQISALREDFQQERADRERMASRCASLQLQLEAAEKEHNMQMTRMSALMNTRAYNRNRVPGYRRDADVETEEEDMDITREKKRCK